MKELVILSGKGGTGKTSVTAAFATLAEKAVIADCDVDAADLHLLLQPRILRREEFRSGHTAVIRQKACIGCGACLACCRFDAVQQVARGAVEEFFGLGQTTCDNCEVCERSCPVKFVDVIQAMKETGCAPPAPAFIIAPTACEGCGVCVAQCPVKAIEFPERVAGEWYLSDTRLGPMVHARLNPGGENSGKLVARVREEARALAEARSVDLILLDGPPGIGCPAIASITGAALAVIVTEPTLSGLHDLERVLGLAHHFKVPAMVCVNKWDINPAQTEAIERRAAELGARIAGRIRYDRAVTDAQVKACSVVDIPDSPAGADVRSVWDALGAEIGRPNRHEKD